MFRRIIRSAVAYYLFSGVSTMDKRLKIAVMAGGWNGEVLDEILSGIYQCCAANNADVYAFCCYGGWSEDPVYNMGEYNIFSLLNTEEYDGFIIVSRTISSFPVREGLRKRLQASGKPCVSIEHDMEGIHYVGIDNYEAMFHMVEHLIVHHKCRVLNYIGGPADDYENSERCRAFRDALIRYDISIDERRIAHFGYKYSDGTAAFSHFRNMGFEKPDAVVCANDELAVGYCCEAGRNGLRAPGDFLITGFDNFRFAETFSPRLTTVDREKEQSGFHSCAVLFDLISGIDIPHRTMLKSHGIFAQSCGCESTPTMLGQLTSDDVIENSLKNDALMLTMNRMKKGLVKCDNFDDYYAYLLKYMPMLDASAFYILTNQSEQRTVLHMDEPYRSRGYDTTMNVSFAYADGSRLSLTSAVQTSDILPVSPASEGFHLYLIAPLHFQDHCKGYCITVDSLALFRQNAFYDWINGINLSMETVREKQILAMLNEKLNLLYMEDSLTGLYNRYGFSVKANDRFLADIESGDDTLIMFMDINSLKDINDTYGHEYGDLAIRTFASIIQSAAPRFSVAVRYGGDEFLIVCRCRDPHTPDSLKASIAKGLEAYNKASMNPFDISVSIGYVIAHPDGGGTLEDYVKDADTLMYSEKKRKH